MYSIISVNRREFEFIRGHRSGCICKKFWNHVTR